MSTVRTHAETLALASDEQLMAAYLCAVQAAFNVLFERHALALRRYFLRHGKSKHDALDLVQQTFLKLHRSREDFRQGESLRPWLYTIARNTRHDHSRRCQRRPEVYCDVDREACAEPSSDALVREERARALTTALDSLPHAQRALLHEHWLSERSWPDIAARRGTPAGTLRVRAHRACLLLRDQLDNELAVAAA